MSARVNGWRLSFSPVDGWFHVEDGDGVTAAAFPDFRAALRWARQHALTPALDDLTFAGELEDRARRASGDPGRAARRRTGHRRRGG